MNGQPPIRFGIFGTGRVARAFAIGVTGVDGAKLEGVASRSVANAGAFAGEFPGTRAVGSYRALVDDPHIDVVYIATPHQLHAQHSIMCLDAGKAVICEKPFTLDAPQARTVLGVARERRLFCMEAMWMRFIPAIQRAVEIVASGTIGEPRLLHADFGVPTPMDPSGRFFDPEQGGGALLDRGVYAVSLASMLFGRPEQIAAAAGFAPTGVDEHSGIVLRFARGELAVLSASLTSLTSNAALITGTHGSVALPPPFFCPERLTVRHYRAVDPDPAGSRREGITTLVKRTSPGRRALRLMKPLLTGRARHIDLPFAGNGYGYEAAEAVRCLRAGDLESPHMRLDDSLMIMETLDTIRAASAGADV